MAERNLVGVIAEGFFVGLIGGLLVVLVTVHALGAFEAKRSIPIELPKAMAPLQPATPTPEPPLRFET